MDPSAISARIDSLIEEQQELVKRARGDGRKVVGYLPGGYVPEELIYASGAIPLCLAQVGDGRSLDAAQSLVPSLMCPFVRAEIGNLVLKAAPFFSAVDLLVVPSTCQHLKKVGDIVEYFGQPPLFKLGVPYQREGDFELAYYQERLAALRARLESVTGSSLSDARLVEAIALYERMRRLLRELSLTRRERPPALRALDFIRLNQASLFADPVAVVGVLESVYRDAVAGAAGRPVEEAGASKVAGGDAGAARQASGGAGPGRPRVLLTGPNLALGDYEIVKLTSEAGADIVIEEIFEGMRDYWHSVDLGPADAEGAEAGGETDPLAAIARGYLLGKRPAAFMRGSPRKRLEFALDLIRDFDVSGVLWYQLQCCEFYDQESYYFQRMLADRGIPLLVVESDYRGLDSGPIKTRLEAFVEIMTGGPADA